MKEIDLKPIVNKRNGQLNFSPSKKKLNLPRGKDLSKIKWSLKWR